MRIRYSLADLMDTVTLAALSVYLFIVVLPHLIALNHATNQLQIEQTISARLDVARDRQRGGRYAWVRIVRGNQ